MRIPDRWVLPAIAVFLSIAPNAGSSETSCRRFLVEERVHVSLVFGSDGHAGQLSWLDTVSGRRGDAPFETADTSLLHVEMPGGWCAPARLVADAALLFQPPPWDPAGRGTALGIGLD